MVYQSSYFRLADISIAYNSGIKTLNQREQLELMLAEIKNVIKKHTGEERNTVVILDKVGNTEKLQLIIRIENVSEMKIAFRNVL